MRLFGVVGGTRQQLRAATLTIPFDLPLATQKAKPVTGYIATGPRYQTGAARNWP